MTNKKRALPTERKTALSTSKITNLPPKPGVDAPSVVVKRKGPHKEGGVIPRRKIGGKIMLKDDQVLKKEQTKTALKKKATPIEVVEKREPHLKAVELPSEGYVRFRMRVKDAEMSIVDSHRVEGKLVTPSTVDGNYLYEVTLGEKRLHVDSVPDLGVRRSFTNIKGTDDARREHSTHLSTYEFDVRVPEKELKEVELSNIDIALYRTKERPKKMKLGLRSLDVEFEKELREVTRLKGIKGKTLPK